MRPGIRRFGSLSVVLAALISLLLIIASQSIEIPVRDSGSGVDFVSERNVAFALPAGLVLDHGDPNISDSHVDFMDRGRYPFQDLVAGLGCGGGLVNVVHGNLVYTRQDLTIPGRGLPLEVRFTYNSGSFFSGRYGYGWQLNYNLRYITNSINENVIIVREDDRTDIFAKQADGSYRPTYGVRDVLQSLPGGGYLLADRGGTKYYIDSPEHHYVTRVDLLLSDAVGRGG